MLVPKKNVQKKKDVKWQTNDNLRNLTYRRVLYFVDRASRHKFWLITNPMHFFMHFFIHFISLNVSSIKCSSSGDRIVLIHHLV